MLLNARVIEPRNAPDIDPDFSEIGYRIHIKPGPNSADVEGRGSEIAVGRYVELERFQHRECAGGLERRVDPKMRHRSMSGDSLERQAEPEGALVADQC